MGWYEQAGEDALTLVTELSYLSGVIELVRLTEWGKCSPATDQFVFCNFE